MEKILNDVRRDAIEKLKEADTEALRLLTDTASYIYSLAKIRRFYSLSAVEQAVKDSPSEFFRSVCTYTSDPFEYGDAVELVTNEYWSRNPQGVQAMITYLYIWTALYIPEPHTPEYFRCFLQSLIPAGSLRREFEQLMEKADQEMESLREKEISERYSHIIRPVFQDAEALENIHTLESVLTRLPDRSVQRLLQEISLYTLSACIFAFSDAVRDRVMHNLSRHYGTAVKETVVQLHPIDEKEVSRSITEVLLLLGQLETNGEISLHGLA